MCRYSLACLSSLSGRSPLGRRLAFVSSCEAQAGAAWKGWQRVKGAEAAKLFTIYKFPELPALAPPPGGRRGGRRGAGALGTPGSRLAAAAAGVGVGTGRVSPGAQAARRARIAPRASRVGLERLCPGSRERLGSECWSPHFCVWLPGELGSGSEALRVSAELSRFLPRSLSAGGSRLRVERGLGERNRHRVTD